MTDKSKPVIGHYASHENTARIPDPRQLKMTIVSVPNYSDQLIAAVEVLKSISQMAHKYPECLMSADHRAAYSPRCPRCMAQEVLESIVCPECRASQINGAPGTKIGPQVSCAACKGTGLKNGQ